MITIQESTYDDVKNIQELWADADAMGEDPDRFAYMEIRMSEKGR